MDRPEPRYRGQMSEANLLGDYLRARRQLVSPEMVGLPVAGYRRVPGLRREEVAMLAGISADYYLRLEQGRDRHPSVSVLEAISRVLQLDQEATDYLVALALARGRPRRRSRRETVPPGIVQLLEVINAPAYVEGRYFDVLAANSWAQLLTPTMAVGFNRMRAVFLEAGAPELYPDWEAVTAGLVAAFRRAIGTDFDDARFVELVGELSLGSERFRQLWARHDVKSRSSIPVRFRHPQVGELQLTCEKLAVAGTDGQLLAVYYATPGSPSAEKLALLGSLAQPVVAETSPTSTA
jgi:transcriptional regulator with XRE-family HTH domain